MASSRMYSALSRYPVIIVSWFPISHFTKNMKYMDDWKFIEEYTYIKFNEI